ncbi:MAG: hybrid sensor histidine kinase/response regulator [Bacteroidales bacterium]|nr:hybrid sensor histidine kinase/response regulator [Bacteroidales bacterium]
MEKAAHILVVDDVLDNVKILCGLLEAQSYLTTYCLSGVEAIEKASIFAHDLILLDIMMPNLDGFETARILQNNAASKDIPIIFLTAKSDIDSLSKGFESGGVDYISKPFNKRELLARVKIHVELQNKRKKLLELNQTKDKLFSIISHDLKSPFNSLIGLSDLLVNDYHDRLDKDIQEIVTNIHQSSMSFYNLLENLLEWSRTQRGEIKFEPEFDNINELIARLYEIYSPQCIKKGIHFLTEVDNDLIYKIDVNILETVFRNLISNAIKFTPTGGTITIYAKNQADSIYFCVKDTGIGISKINLPKIFDLSEGFKTKGTNNEKGTGLGLIISKEFIEKHNSHINVKSEIGIGSEFSFTIFKK